MVKQTRINVTEITVLTGRTKAFRLSLDDRTITIPVDETLFTNYQNQFWKEHPTPSQRKRFSTLMSLLREAYRKGLEDGKAKR